MHDQSEQQNNDPTWQQWLALLSPDGQRQIVEFIHEARERHGADWLPVIKAEYPLASWIVELVATKTADDALTAVAQAYPKWPIRLLAGEKIKALHAVLLAEINKPR